MGRIKGLPNGGEKMPKTYPWELKFNEHLKLQDFNSPLMDKDIKKSGKKVLIGGAVENPKDTATLLSLATYSAPLARTKIQRIRKRPYSFIYMDCGRWGGDKSNKHGMQRNFGIIWGKWVVLCNYLGFGYKLPDIIDKRNKGKALIDRFIRGLCTPKSSVYIIKKLYCHEAKNVNWNKIYILLPDLHLPIVTYKWGYQLEVEGRFTTDLADINVSLDRWYKLYKDGDIFNGAAKDLTDFFLLVCSNPEVKAQHLHIVQLGDMYDFWVGIKLFFQKSKHGFPIQVSRSGRKIIKKLVMRTHQENKSLFDAIQYAIDSGHRMTFLYGNHDNYLAHGICPYIQGFPRRKNDLLIDNIYMEHGHDADSSNRDGATSGYSITRGVFFFSKIRSFDPNRRAIWTLNAVLSWIKKPKFLIYVMAHTHSPYLTRVEFTLKAQKAKELEAVLRQGRRMRKL